MMKRLLAMLFLFLTVDVSAQEPAIYSLKGYGGNSTDLVDKDVIATQDGGFVLSLSSYSDIGTGNIDSFCSANGDHKVFIKFNADASSIEWSKCYKNDGDSFLMYMFPKSDGAVMGGQFKSSQGWGFYIARHDAVGNIIWSKSYSKGNSPLLRTIIATSDGGYIMAGDAFYTDTNVSVHYGSWAVDDIWVIKLDSSGNKLWSTVIGGSGFDNIANLVETTNGEIFVVGSTSSTDHDCIDNHGGTSDGFIARLDNTGGIIWSRCLGGTSTDGISAACSNGAGGIILAGVTSSSDGDVQNNNGVHRWWLLEISSSNVLLWDSCYDGLAVSNVCKASDGSIWIGGYVQGQGGQVVNSYGGRDAYFVHTGSNGSYLGSLVLGSSKNDECGTVYPLSNGFVFAGGRYNTNSDLFAQLPSFNTDPSFHSDAFLALFAPWSTSAGYGSKHTKTISIYPNPANQDVQVEFSEGTFKYLIISDSGGRIVYLERISVKQRHSSVEIAHWPSGLYCAQLLGEITKSETVRFIVQ